MKLVIVDRSKAATYERMRQLLANDANVAVIWDRRSPQERRRAAEHRTPDRRAEERRQKVTDFGGRGFIVVDVDEAAVLS